MVISNIKIIFLILLLNILFSDNDRNKSGVFSISRIQYGGGGDWYADKSSIPNLLKFISENTDIITADDQQVVKIGDNNFFSSNYLYMTGHGNIKLTDEEIIILREHLIGGAFLHADDNYGMDQSFRELLSKMFPEKELIEIPPNHELFNIYFEFPNGLPKIHEHDNKRAQALGIFHKEKLIILYTYESDLGDGWEDPKVHNNPEDLRQKCIKNGDKYCNIFFSSIKMKNIFQFIQTFRKIESNRNFSNRIFNLISFLIIFTFILINFLEEIFYFSSFARRNFVIFFLTLTLSSFLLFFTQWIINFFGIINNNEKIAIRIGNRIPKIKDKLLNILQLNNINPNLDLTKLATKNLSNDLRAFNVKEIVDKTQLKYLYLTIFSLIIFSVNMLNPSMRSSIYRILNFNTEFIPLTPFKITNLNSFESALSGDSISLNFGLEGNVIPDSIQLYLNINDEIKKINLNNINNNFNHNINNVKDDFEYWTKFEPYSFFSKWDSIGTEPKKFSLKKDLKY